jgi:hypothetical protein
MKQLLSFREYLLTESPVAYPGDFKGNKVKLNLIGSIGIHNYYDEIPLIRSSRLLTTMDIRVFISKRRTKAVIGFFNEDSFVPCAELFLTVYKHIDSLGYKNVLQTSEVQTDYDSRNEGYASSLYLSLIEAGNTLISDYSQFDGARNLWRSISSTNNIKLDVYDDIERTVTKDHIIVHTDIANLDKEWSCAPNNKCDNILFIAYK